MNSYTSFSVVVAAAFAAASFLPAQVAWIHRGANAIAIEPPTRSTGPSSPPPLPCPMGPAVPVLATGALPAGAAPLGGMAFDESTGLFAFSTGPSVRIVQHPTLPPLVPPPPPGPYAVPSAPSAASPGGVFGAITGMAAGFVPLYGSVLWVTDGRAIMGLSLLPPFAILRAPFAIAAAPAGTPPISGLEYDPIAATLWACNTAGACFEVQAFPRGFPGGGGTPAGATVGGPFVPAAAPAGAVVGVVRDRRNFAGLWVTDGIALYPVIVPLAGVLPLPIGSGTTYGACFVPEPLRLASGGACLGAVPQIGLSRVPTWGGLLPFTVNVTGGFPDLLTLLGIDLTCTATGTSTALFGGLGTWWLPLGTAFIVGPFPLDATGSAAIPLALSPELVGLRLLAQAATLCALVPDLTVTPVIAFTIALP